MNTLRRLEKRLAAERDEATRALEDVETLISAVDQVLTDRLAKLEYSLGEDGKSIQDLNRADERTRELMYEHAARLGVRIARLEAIKFSDRIDRLDELVARHQGDLAKWATRNADAQRTLSKRIGRLELAAKV